MRPPSTTTPMPIRRRPAGRAWDRKRTCVILDHGDASMTDVTAEDSVQGDEQQPARDPVDQQLVDRRGPGARRVREPWV